MAHDPLDTLIKLRRLSCDDAARKLATALTDEDHAERNTHSIERTIAEETAAASDLDGSDAVVEAFGAWLPRARQLLDDSRRVLSARQAETSRVRAELTACRTALESVETLQEQKRARDRHALERSQARELDDRPLHLSQAIVDQSDEA